MWSRISGQSIRIPSTLHKLASIVGHIVSGSRSMRAFKCDMCNGPTVSHFA